MQRLTREDFLNTGSPPNITEDLSLPANWQEEWYVFVTPATDKARKLHRRRAEIEWKLEMDAIEENCGYRMI